MIDYPPNIRIEYLDDYWTVLGSNDQFVTIMNERTGRLLQVMPDLLEVCR